MTAAIDDIKKCKENVRKIRYEVMTFSREDRQTKLTPLPIPYGFFESRTALILVHSTNSWKTFYGYTEKSDIEVFWVVIPRWSIKCKEGWRIRHNNELQKLIIGEDIVKCTKPQGIKW